MLLKNLSIIIKTDTLAIAAIIILIFGSIIFVSYYFSRKQKILRALKSFKAKRITQFRTNELTKTTGKVLHVHEPLKAPFTRRDCVAYHIKIEQHRSTGKSSHWKTLVSDYAIQDFFIEQQGEVVMVKPKENPKNYMSFMVSDHSANSGTFNDPTPEFKNLLKRYNVNSETILGFNKRLRYTERILEIGEVITVGGIAKWKEMNAPMSQYGSTRIATLESSNEQKLVITDEPSAKVDYKRI
ncbi:hypothetical protein RM697_04900 [Ichthyenterobacterium sp. W332]|uniref:RING-type E3 ubiquitin transferase n=1 Tax=Microcosmobacter mediterraneus TaxID=3075607 RepID=A0ABU2YIJ2_9FLAO|nr:hypothetical protein [Ichthyenterobacterium sp. W332]MDT0557971.1 hypothetical protein [Ichthyenterobacterium sp. W332]